MPLRGLEEQAVLRRLASRDRLHGDWGAAEWQDRRAAGARWRAGDRSAGQRTPEGAREPRDHERHRARGRAGDVHLPVPLRRQRQQALLRRHAHEDRLPVGLTLGRGAQFSPEAFQKMVLRVGAITGLGFCVLKPELTRPGAPPERPPESCAAPMTTVVNWPLIGTVAITGEGGRPPPTNELLRTPPHAAPLALMPPEALNRLTQ